MNLVKRRLVLAGLISLSLVAVACGSDSKSSSATTPATAGEATQPRHQPTSQRRQQRQPPLRARRPRRQRRRHQRSTSPSCPEAWSAVAQRSRRASTTMPSRRFRGIAPDLTVEYGGGGSGKGQTDLQSNVVDFAGTDGAGQGRGQAEVQGRRVRLRPDGDRADHDVVQPAGVDKLQLSPASISAIFQREITKWNDPVIAADNPGVTLPDTTSSSPAAPTALAPPRTSPSSSMPLPAPTAAARGSSAAAPEQRVARRHAGRRRQQWRGPDRVVHRRRHRLRRPQRRKGQRSGVRIGEEQGRQVHRADPRRPPPQPPTNAKINDDLTYFLGWADGDAAYPIAAQTWIIAYTKQADPAKAEALRGFLTYLLTDGQKAGVGIDFAPLPADLQAKALLNIAKIGA